MDRNCFICANPFDLTKRRPIILQCCFQSLCRICFESLPTNDTPKCPTCRETEICRRIVQENLNIVQDLNLEQHGNIKCEECSGSKSAIKHCESGCGNICKNCIDVHSTMRTFKSHQLRNLPQIKWSNNSILLAEFSQFCKLHENYRLLSFCRNCKSALCEKCCEERCSGNHERHSIEGEFNSCLQDLKQHVQELKISSLEKEFSLEVEQQKKLHVDTENELNALKEQCLNILKQDFEDVINRFKEKKGVYLTQSTTLLSKLTEIENSCTNVEVYLEQATELDNKTGFMASEQNIRNFVKKLEEKETDIIKQLDLINKETNVFKWLYDIIKDLRLYDDRKHCLDIAFHILDTDVSYPQLQMFMKEYRKHQSMSSGAEAFPVCTGKHDEINTVDWKISEFPRFEYHFDLTEQVSKQIENVVNINVRKGNSLKRILETALIVGGTVTESFKTTLAPLSLQTENLSNIQEKPYIILHISESATLCEAQTLVKELQAKVEGENIWNLLVMDSNDINQFNEAEIRILNDERISVVANTHKAVWNVVTSALELLLIDFLLKMGRMSGVEDHLRGDIATICSRIETTSAILIKSSESQSLQEIPSNIMTIIERYKFKILRYGIFKDRIRIIVKDEYKAELEKQISKEKTNTKMVQVISAEKVRFTQYCKEMQGRKLFPQDSVSVVQRSEATNQNKEHYGTLGCIASLNNSVVGLSGKHVCVEGSTVYISMKDKNVPLGKCLYGITESDLCILNDLAIIDIKEDILQTISDKRITDHRGNPTNAYLLEGDVFRSELMEDIVHKLGASSEWTQGKIQGVENAYILVEGMLGRNFAEPGDSGSVIFRVSKDSTKRGVEVLAILSGKETIVDSEKGKESGDKCSKTKEISTCDKIMCSLLKNSFEALKSKHKDLESISFFNKDH